MAKQPIIFTDLDGTLLSHDSYSFTAALPALRLIRSRDIPLVFCSSKTRPEIDYWREELENHHPFIVENGGAIYVPHSCFCTSDLKAVCPIVERREHYLVAVLGKPYKVLRDALQELQKDGYDIKGFGDMTAGEVADITGLSLDEASLAKNREFDEPFVFQGDEAKASGLSAHIHAKGLRCSQGMLHHLTGDNDKGRAVDLLKKLYKRKFSTILTIGLGDSPIDFPMLERVDYPVLVRNCRGEHDPRIELPNLIRVEGQGPEGWNTAVLEFMREEL